MDVFSFNSAKGYKHYTYDGKNLGTPGTWHIIRYENDYIHARELDPGVKVWIQANVAAEDTPVSSFQVTTGNGISAVSAGPVP
jgi:hypothetical protein